MIVVREGGFCENHFFLKLAWETKMGFQPFLQPCFLFSVEEHAACCFSISKDIYWMQIFPNCRAKFFGREILLKSDVTPERPRSKYSFYTQLCNNFWKISSLYIMFNGRGILRTFVVVSSDRCPFYKECCTPERLDILVGIMVYCMIMNYPQPQLAVLKVIDVLCRMDGALVFSLINIWSHKNAMFFAIGEDMFFTEPKNSFLFSSECAV